MARKCLEGVAGLRRKTLTQPFTKSTGKRADELIRASLNIEMQTSDNHRIINGALETEKVPVLPLRIRYYQSLISTDMLLKGMQYWQLRKSYVIFICTFDPFRQGLPMYRFSYRCRENLSLEMGDLTENIFLNATAADKATDKELAAFLSYVNGKAAESSFTKNLDNEVKRIRDSEDWRFHAMYYEAETQFHEWLGATLPQHLPETGQMFFYKFIICI